MINELASYFLQVLFCKATDSGHQCYKTLVSVLEKTHSFDTARRLILKFQEVSPWTTFGHVAANGVILEALDGETTIHVINISTTLCTQWPTLLEAMAKRNDETPWLKLTVGVTASIVQSVMKDVGQRMEKFARLMGVPFEINVVSGSTNMEELTKDRLGIKDDEALAINCMGTLRRIDVERRDSILRTFGSFVPRVVTVVEEEADLLSTREDFVRCFEECLRFYAVYFETLEESFPTMSNERECSQSIARVLACDDDPGGSGEDCERRGRGVQWSERLRKDFSPVAFSDDTVDDLKALLKRYQTGWSLVVPEGGTDTSSESGLYLTWRDEPVVWTSAWKP